MNGVGGGPDGGITGWMVWVEDLMRVDGVGGGPDGGITGWMVWVEDLMVA